MLFNSFAIIGAGAWGTALATVAARAGRAVTLYARDAAHAAHISKARENPRLSGIKLAADITLIVTPAQHLRGAVNAVAPHSRARTPIIACAKGIEHGTHKFMTEIIAECAPKALPAILSGPSFAADVARGLPTAVTVAAADADVAEALAHAMNSGTFRPYHSTDVFFFNDTATTE